MYYSVILDVRFMIFYPKILYDSVKSHSYYAYGFNENVKC